MAPAASFQAQLASIMEVLANTAVAEICELVDESCALLRLEAARSRRENEALRRKLRLMELRAARNHLPADDASAGRGGVAPPTAAPCGQEDAYLTPPTGGSDTPPDTDTPPAPPVKVEEEEPQSESWSPEVPVRLPSVSSPPLQAPPLPVKQEAERDDGASASWTGGGERDHSALVERRSAASHDASRQDPSCSYARRSALSQDSQAVAPPADWPRPPGGRRRAEEGGGVARGASRFVCSCCGKRLACLKNLKTHMRVHTGEKPFACARCGKRFSDSSNLKRHQSVHTGERRYGCVHCGKRFAQSGSLKVHMSAHGDCKQFACSRCGKTFISGGHLRRHLSAHAPPPPP